MKTLLAIDSACDLLCLALRLAPAGPGTTPRDYELCVDDGLRHAELLAEGVDALCRLAGAAPESIGGIVCGGGPGSFTGLRIGMAYAKGLAEALGCGLCAASGLDAIAWSRRHWPGPVLSAVDARKQRFYLGLARAGRPLAAHADLAAAEVGDWLAACGVGAGEALLLAGPDAALLGRRWAEVGAPAPAWTVDADARRGWGLALLDLGERELAAGRTLAPEGGPEYVRASDAELGITKKAP